MIILKSNSHHAAVSNVSGVVVPVMGRREWSTRFDGNKIRGTSLIGGRRPQGGRALDTPLERVASITLDDVLAASGPTHPHPIPDPIPHPIPDPISDPIAFLKIDAEGFDGRVLRGAHRLIAAGRVRTIYWESNPVQVTDTIHIYHTNNMIDIRTASDRKEPCVEPCAGRRQ